MADGGPFLGGCKLHGTSLDVPDPDEDEKQHFHESSSPLDSPLPTASPVRSPLANGSPRLTSRGHTPTFDHSRCSSTMHKSCVCVNFIAEHTRAKEDATKVVYRTEKSAFCIQRIPPFRPKKTGSTWQWCWIGFFYGFLRWQWWLVPLG